MSYNENAVPITAATGVYKNKCGLEFFPIHYALEMVVLTPVSDTLVCLTTFSSDLLFPSICSPLNPICSRRTVSRS